MQPPGKTVSKKHQLGLISCVGIVFGNMIEGIALMPANLAQIGSVSLFGWLIVLVGALALAYVYARLAVLNPQSGGPIAYAQEVGSALGFQSGVLYYNANWIGNLAIGITAVAYLSTFFPILNETVPAALACIALIWMFAGLNLLGCGAVGRVAVFGLLCMLIPVAATAFFGWFWFDPALYARNWNVSHLSDGEAVARSIPLCLWAFIGIESASVSAGLVKNPRKTVPLATILGVGLAGLVYVLSFQAIAGLFPAEEMAGSGAPFAKVIALMVGDWAYPLVALGTVVACLTSLSSWMMIVSQAGVRAAEEGHFPKIYAERDANGIPRKGIVLAAVQMTVLMLVVMCFNLGSSAAVELFEVITEIAVLLTILPYFYSCIDLLRVDGAMQVYTWAGVGAALTGSLFCFMAFAGAGTINLTATVAVSLAVVGVYAWRIGRRQRGTPVLLTHSAAG